MPHNALIFFELALFLYISYMAGVALLPRLGVKAVSGITYTVQAILLGLGIFALAGLVFGLLGIFNTITLWAFTALLLFYARTHIRAHCRAFTKENASRVFRAFVGLFKEHTFFKILIVVWVVANFSLAFVPITAHDTLDYHLPIVLDIVAKGRTDFTSAIEHYQFAPALAEILYAVPAVMFGEVNAPYGFQILQFMTLPLFLALVYGFVRKRVAWSFLAPAAVLAILGIMDFQREVLHGGYVDTFAFLYGFASILPILEYATRDKRVGGGFPEFVFSGVMLGISLGMKHFGFFFGALALVFFAVAWRRFRLSAREIAKMLFVWGAIIAALAVFWYAKNYWWFGNPVYPMFSQDPSMEITLEGVRSFVVERAPLNFVIFPFALFGQWFLNPAVESSSRLVVFAYFILLYAFIGLRVWSRKKFTLSEILLFVFVQGYLAFHFVLSHYVRYLLPPIIILPALLALLADGLFASAQARFSSARFSIIQKMAKYSCAITLIFLFLGNLHYFQIRFSYIIGLYSEREYVFKIGSQ